MRARSFRSKLRLGSKIRTVALVLLLVLQIAGPIAARAVNPRSAYAPVSNTYSKSIAAGADDVQYIYGFAQLETGQNDLFIETGSYTSAVALHFKGFNLTADEYVSYLELEFTTHASYGDVGVNDQRIDASVIIGSDIFTLNASNLATFNKYDYEGRFFDGTYFDGAPATGANHSRSILFSSPYAADNMQFGYGYSGDVVIILTPRQATDILGLRSFESGNAPTLKIHASTGEYSGGTGSEHVDTVNGYDIWKTTTTSLDNITVGNGSVSHNSGYPGNNDFWANESVAMWKYTGSSGVVQIAVMDRDTGVITLNTEPSGLAVSAEDISFAVMNNNTHLFIFHSTGIDYYNGTLLANHTFSWASKVDYVNGAFTRGDVTANTNGLFVGGDISGGANNGHWYASPTSTFPIVTDFTDWQADGTTHSKLANHFFYAFPRADGDFFMGLSVNNLNGADWEIEFGMRLMAFDGSPSLGTDNHLFADEYDEWDTRYSDHLLHDGDNHMFYYYGGNVAADPDRYIYHRKNESSVAFGNYVSGDTSANLMSPNCTYSDYVVALEYNSLPAVAWVEQNGTVFVSTINGAAVTTSTLFTESLAAGTELSPRGFEAIPTPEGFLFYYTVRNTGNTWYVMKVKEFRTSGIGTTYTVVDGDGNVVSSGLGSLEAALDAVTSAVQVAYDTYWTEETYLGYFGLGGLLAACFVPALIVKAVKEFNIPLAFGLFIVEACCIALAWGWLA